MRRLTIRVERSVVERYEVDVPDDFDADDKQAVGELLAEGDDKPKPIQVGESEPWEAFVENDVTVTDD